MQIFKEIGPLKAFLNQQTTAQRSIGLVPTMGALHAGHLSLIEASKAENQVTVCSIYVNPTQFNNPSDLAKYPRMPEKDSMMLAAAGCDVLFIPDNSEMYVSPSLMKIDFGPMDKILEGEFRPGHFSGVGLVVSKLFNIVLPDRAYFGQKDFQQFSIIARLVEELRFGIELRCIPTLREPDGLAMSSRNLRLSPEERLKATIFYRCFGLARQAFKENKSLTQVKNIIKSTCEAESGVRLDYFEVANRTNLILLESVNDPDQTIMLIAGFVGEIRLIDNMMVREQHEN